MSRLSQSYLHALLMFANPMVLNNYGLSRHMELVSIMSLSHRWGQRQKHPPRKGKGNLKAHLDAIPWESLSNPFQDAITLTRGIGLRYIWIDSLCIDSFPIMWLLAVGLLNAHLCSPG